MVNPDPSHRSQFLKPISIQVRFQLHRPVTITHLYLFLIPDVYHLVVDSPLNCVTYMIEWGMKYLTKFSLLMTIFFYEYSLIANLAVLL